jgi:hypothetical protein
MDAETKHDCNMWTEDFTERNKDFTKAMIDDRVMEKERLLREREMQALTVEPDSADKPASIVCTDKPDKPVCTDKPDKPVEPDSVDCIVCTDKPDKPPNKPLVPNLLNVQYYLNPVSHHLLQFDSTEFKNDLRNFIRRMSAFLEVMAMFQNKASRMATSQLILAAVADDRHILFKPTDDVRRLVLIIKAKFDEFIIREHMVELIPIYNKIFNDNLYDGELYKAETDADLCSYMTLSEDESRKLLEDYKHRLYTRKKVAKGNYKAKTFTKGEIVGAKDRDGHWWLSRIIDMFKYDDHTGYYVEFLGWGDKFNEFIVDKCRIAKFNPKKHILYRGTAKLEDADKDEDIANAEDAYNTYGDGPTGGRYRCGYQEDNTANNTENNTEAVEDIKDNTKSISEFKETIMSEIVARRLEKYKEKREKAQEKDLATRELVLPEENT